MLVQVATGVDHLVGGTGDEGVEFVEEIGHARSVGRSDRGDQTTPRSPGGSRSVGIPRCS